MDAKGDSLTPNGEEQKKAGKMEQTDPELRKEKRIALVIGLVFGLVFLGHFVLYRVTKGYN